MLKGLSTSAITLLVAGVGLGACVDAKKRFDEFDDRVPVIDASTVDRPTIPISNIDGTWYMAVKALGVNLHLFVTWDITINGTTATLNGSYQPLSAPPGVDPPPRMSVGAPIVGNNVMVDDTATFTAPITGTINGMANPISGSDILSMVNLVGTIKSTTLVCGVVTGQITVGSPIPSGPDWSFAAVPAADLDHLPALPPTDRCP